MCLSPFLSLTRLWSSSFHYPGRRSAGRHTCGRSACILSSGSTAHRRSACTVCHRIIFIGARSYCLSLRPVYDIEKVPVVGFFHIALNDSVEEVGSSCSVDELDGEVLVACLLSKLSVIVNVLGTDELCREYGSRVSYLFVCAVYQRVVHRELVGIGVAYEAAVSQTEGTFSQAEIVCDDAEVKICVLILCKELSEQIESSVEGVVESDLVNAPVAPVFNMLDSCRISVKTESNENVLELSLYIFDEDRGIESECSYTHIVHLVDKFTDLFAHNGVNLVLIH